VAGLKPGDRIVSFNGEDNPKWSFISDDAALSPAQPLPLTVERNGQRLPLTITPTAYTESGDTIGLLDFLPNYGNLPIVVRRVEDNSPAAEAGLRVGDHIVAIGGEPVTSAEQITQYIRDHKSVPITLSIERNGQRRDITATTRRLSDGRERLGFSPDEDVPYQRVGLIGSAAFAVDTNVEVLRVTGKAFGQFIKGKRSARNTISGPVGIYRAASTSANRFGWGGVVHLLAVLSLSLGIFNLLPIPVLDGGAIFLLIIEGLLALLGLAISVKMRERIQQVGFVVVLLLMVFVITNDLLKEVSIRRSANSNAPTTATPGK
jgi:regulator of sigma E protease